MTTTIRAELRSLVTNSVCDRPLVLPLLHQAPSAGAPGTTCVLVQEQHADSEKVYGELADKQAKKDTGNPLGIATTDASAQKRKKTISLYT